MLRLFNIIGISFKLVVAFYSHNAKVLCCRLWMCIIWIIIINVVGVVLSIRRLYNCHQITLHYLIHSMNEYKQAPKHKQFIDNVQWSLKCCGLNSYNDWFSQDWHDKVRDYEWDPVVHQSNKQSKNEIGESDSVPLSCCKSGSCVSNYLRELGTSSINTNGCGDLLCRVIMISMNFHVFLFGIVIFLEAMMLKHISSVQKPSRYWKIKSKYVNLRHLMPVRSNFLASSDSYQLNPEESDEIDLQQDLIEN